MQFLFTALAPDFHCRYCNQPGESVSLLHRVYFTAQMFYETKNHKVHKVPLKQAFDTCGQVFKHVLQNSQSKENILNNNQTEDVQFHVNIRGITLDFIEGTSVAHTYSFNAWCGNPFSLLLHCPTENCQIYFTCHVKLAIHTAQQ